MFAGRVIARSQLGMQVALESKVYGAAYRLLENKYVPVYNANYYMYILGPSMHRLERF